MPKRASLTNVRKLLEWIDITTRDMLDRDGKHQGGLVLAPIDRGNLAQIGLITRAVLKKNPKTPERRKDIRVGA